MNINHIKKIYKMKKQELIDQRISKPFEKGDSVYVRGLGIQDKSRFGNIATLTDADSDFGYIGKEKIPHVDLKHWTGDIGANPFPKRGTRISNIGFSLDSIIHTLGLLIGKTEYQTKAGHTIKPCNWNPFVVSSKGEKEYYQRPFVWSEEDNRNLIDSIYNNIDCGKVLVRNRDWNECELAGEEAAWKDIVDGKQRMNAIRAFVNNEFKDSCGNYYDDLSHIAQHYFGNHQLFSYSELPENSKDSDVLEQFLKLNFCGVPQSKEHIEFVKSIRI